MHACTQAKCRLQRYEQRSKYQYDMHRILYDTHVNWSIWKLGFWPHYLWNLNLLAAQLQRNWQLCNTSIKAQIMNNNEKHMAATESHGRKMSLEKSKPRLQTTSWRKHATSSGNKFLLTQQNNSKEYTNYTSQFFYQPHVIQARSAWLWHRLQMDLDKFIELGGDTQTFNAN